MTGTLFETETKILKPLLTAEHRGLTALATGAILGTMLSIIFPLPKPADTIALAGGLTSAGGFTLEAFRMKKKEKLVQVLENEQLQSLKRAVNLRAAEDESMQLMRGTLRMFEQVISSNIPDEQKMYFLEEFDLLGLLPQQQQAVLAEGGYKTIPVSAETVAHQSLPAAPEPFLEGIVYDWIDRDFLIGSKAVCASRGSGKSRYLYMEAAEVFQTEILEQPPANRATLRICDPHFDPRKAMWLPGIPEEVLRQAGILLESVDEILGAFREARRIFRQRKQGKTFYPDDVPLYKLICDEFVAFFGELTKNEQEEVLDIIQEINYQARKYGVELTLALHSIKQKTTGLDSSFFSGMGILCLGNILSDPSMPFPTDFKRDQLLEDQYAVQEELGKGQGYACIVRKHGERPIVEVMPVIEPAEMYRFEWQGGQVAAQLVEQLEAELESKPEAKPKSKPAQPVESFEESIDYWAGGGEQPKPKTYPANEQVPLVTAHEDWYDNLQSWAAAVQVQLKRQPDKNEVRVAFEGLTQAEIDDEGISMLCEALKIK